MEYYAGQVLPGSETRAAELAGSGLSEVLKTPLAPGTFNVGLVKPIELGEPDVEHGPYHLWGCWVATEKMVREDRQGYPGWVLRIAGENYPYDFIEIISPIHLRTAMDRQKWPTFPVEVALT